MAAEVLKFEKKEKPKAAAPKSKRFEALDILRGLFLIGMLLANNAGDWGHIWPPFDHAEWHGFTMTDLVFPGFMVCVGLSMTLSMTRRIGEGGQGQRKVVGRATAYEDGDRRLRQRLERFDRLLPVRELFEDSLLGWTQFGLRSDRHLIEPARRPDTR